MSNFMFCRKSDCEYRIAGHRMARLVRIYIRDRTDQEYKSTWAYKRMKQYFKPIGWMCPYCKDLIIERKYLKNIFVAPEAKKPEPL